MKKKIKPQVGFLLLHVFIIVFLFAQLFYSPFYIQLTIIVFSAAYIFYGASLCVGYLMYGYSHLSDMRLFFGLLSISFGTLGIAFSDVIYDNFLIFTITLLLFSSIFILQRAANMMRNYKAGGKRAFILSFWGIGTTLFCVFLFQYSPEYFENKETISIILLIFNSILLFVYGIIINGWQKAISFATKNAKNPTVNIEDTLEFDSLKVKTKTKLGNVNSANSVPDSSWFILRPSHGELFAKRTGSTVQNENDNIYIYAPLAQKNEQAKTTNENGDIHNLN